MPLQSLACPESDMAITICKATTQDAALIAKTRKIVWEQTYRGIYSDSKLDQYDLAQYEQRDREKLSQADQHFFLFLDDGRCVGYFSYGAYHYGTYKDFSLCLNHLYVIREYQGKGLGKMAFSRIIKYCRLHRIRKFFCGCNANNTPAITFYQHMGGKQGDTFDPALPKEDQIIHFEFYLGE